MAGNDRKNGQKAWDELKLDTKRKSQEKNHKKMIDCKRKKVLFPLVLPFMCFILSISFSVLL